jgi:serine/threonine protein kinase
MSSSPTPERTRPAPPAAEAETVSPAAPSAFDAEPPPRAADGLPPGLADHPRYRVIRLLGQGGMGAVYLAEHRHMERQVALKVISADLVGNPDAVRRFRQEVTAAARLGPHPHVVAVYDADQVGDLHFLVMEYVEGQSLADYLHEKGPLPTAEACDCARQAALGLEHAAGQGMVHRDVKPHNLMRTPQGQVKVLDFGLARCYRETEKARTQLTQQGVLMGTADYMAPEQASDSRATDVRADVYSPGCTLYHLLTGRVPFPGGGTVEKIIKHAVEAPTPVGALRPDLPVGVAQVVEKMMAKALEQRFQTPGEVAGALAPWTKEGAVLPVRPVTLVASPSSSATLPAVRAAGAVPRLPGGPDPDEEVLRQIRSSANFLLVSGYVHCFPGGLLFLLAMLESVAPKLLPPTSDPSQFRELGEPGVFWMALSALLLTGATRMKSRRSYKWAFFASFLGALPVTPFLPVTVPLGIRSLLCLGNPDVKDAFRRRAAKAPG